MPRPSPWGTGVGFGPRTSTITPSGPWKRTTWTSGERATTAGPAAGSPTGVTTVVSPATIGGPVTATPGGGPVGTTPGAPRSGPGCAWTVAAPAAMRMRRVRPAGRRPPVANRPFLPGRLIEILLPSAVIGDRPRAG